MESIQIFINSNIISLSLICESYFFDAVHSQLKKLSTSGQYAAKKVEYRKSSVRAKVEHVFGAVKGLFNYRKTRYRGLMKQTAKLNMMFDLANLYLADRPCLAAWFSTP